MFDIVPEKKISHLCSKGQYKGLILIQFTILNYAFKDPQKCMVACRGDVQLWKGEGGSEPALLSTVP